MHSETLRRLSLFGVLLLLWVVATVLVVPPADQYELSLYEAYPDYFWVLVAGVVVVGLVVILGSLQKRASHAWVFGLLLVLVTNALLLLLPFIRGYQMYGRGDALSHVGYTRDLVVFDSITANIYPPTHLLAMAVTDATGLELMTVAMILPVVFSGIYFGAIGYLLFSLFDSRRQILLGLPFVALPVLRHAHLGFRPFDLSVMLVPLVLYLFFTSLRHPSPAVRATFVVALLAQLLYHPLTAAFTVGIFFLYFLGKHTPSLRDQYSATTNALSLSAAIFLVWYSSFPGIILRLDDVYDPLLGQVTGTPPVEKYTGTLRETSPAVIDVFRVALFRYGIEFLLFGLGFVFIGTVAFLLFRTEYLRSLDVETAMFAGAVVVFSTGGLLFLLFDIPGVHMRAWQLAKIGAIALAGELFYIGLGYLNGNSYRSNLGTAAFVLLVVLIVTLAMLSIFSLHRSPLASESNHQVTEMLVEGSEWTAEHGSGSEELLQVGMHYHRLHDAQYGVDAPSPFETTLPPPHFNYDEYTYLGESYVADRYMAITRKGRIVYPEGFPDYPEHWRYTPADFRQLEQDRTVDRIYDNGDYTQYFVEGIASNSESRSDEHRQAG